MRKRGATVVDWLRRSLGITLILERLENMKQEQLDRLKGIDQKLDDVKAGVGSLVGNVATLREELDTLKGQIGQQADTGAVDEVLTRIEGDLTDIGATLGVSTTAIGGTDAGASAGGVITGDEPGRVEDDSPDAETGGGSGGGGGGGGGGSDDGGEAGETATGDGILVSDGKRGGGE